ncbi:MAG: Ig-like domain-containing protein [Planctomycetes bacterium]|nr:Ig-like domain-containing protein [Planctomycetota bacterium]
MRTVQLARFLAPLALVLVASLGIVACGGGSGGSSNGATGDAAVMDIRVQGIAEPIHTDGTDNPGGVAPVGAFLNARITFTFGGTVDPSSIPGAGPAQSGSIQIIDVNGNLPANGVFTINPSNPRQVFFDAFPPSTNAACFAGFTSNSTYRITLNTQTSNSGPAIMVGDTPLQRGANPIFQVRSCGGVNDDPFTDTNGVPPSVVRTVPAAGTMVNATAIPGFPNNSTVTIDVDEALDPQTVSPNTVILVNRTINAAADIPAAGTVAFTQFGLVNGNPSISRITFTTSVPLADGNDYAIRFAGVKDLAGNDLVVATDALRFTILDANNGQPQVFSDDFSTTDNRLDLASAIVWPGTSMTDPNSGHIAATFPIEVIGNGLDGVGSFTSSMTINSDTQLTPGDPEAEPGTYNFTTLAVGSTSGGTVLTFQSTTDTYPGQVNWPLRFRATSTIDIRTDTTINCNGRQNPTQGGGSLLSTVNSIPGGWGGPGGGRGGTASPSTDGVTDDEYGLPGEGAHTDPQFPSQPGGTLDNIAGTWPAGTHNAFYGGGFGGQSGFGISSPSYQIVGGAGGGGGTASGLTMPQGTFTFQVPTAGETRLGTDGLGTGAPAAGQPGQPMPYMIPPLIDACGGSGGGAGGDRRNGTGNILGARCGGAGGGGGGGIRFSAGGDISIGVLTVINCAGGNGGRVVPPAGFGAGGSGGSIVVQTFGNINLLPACVFNTIGGAPGDTNGDLVINTLLDAEGGQGGSGVIQFEDGAAGFVTTFNTTNINGETLAQVFSFAANVNGTATSKVIDTLSVATDYTAATASVFPGPTGTVTIRLIGIAEDPNNPGNPATSAMSSGGDPLMVGPVDITQFDQLDGFRYFQFQISTVFPAPPATMQGDALPYVDDISISYTR